MERDVQNHERGGAFVPYGGVAPSHALYTKARAWCWCTAMGELLKQVTYPVLALALAVIPDNTFTFIAYEF